MSWQGKTVSQLSACLQYALLMMPIAAAIEEKIPATSTRGSYDKVGTEGKRWDPICCNLSACRAMPDSLIIWPSCSLGSDLAQCDWCHGSRKQVQTVCYYIMLKE